MSTVQAERMAVGDRRRWPRVRVRLSVQLIDSEGSFSAVSGHTVDIGVGGLRAQVDGPLSGSLDATVRIDLSEERSLLCEALVAGGGSAGEGWEYRLAFRNLDAEDVAALEQVVRQAG